MSTPAPLDPTAVKAGDTVTIRVETDPKNGGTFSVTGEAYLNFGPFDDVGVMAVGNYPLSSSTVTLTDHQPAPEPEWKPGTVAVIEADGAVPPGPRRAVRRGGVWHSLDKQGYAIDANVTDVRPLAVIDPATVGPTDALVKAFDDAYYETNSTVGGLRAVLRHLGIEVSR